MDTNDTNDTNVQLQLAMSSPNYLVTAGDVYVLSFAIGGNAVKYPISVDTNYKMQIANLATIDARGKTYLQVKEQACSIVLKNYPLAAPQFVLMTPATFMVTIKGEVKATIEKPAWALSRLSSIISGSMTQFSSTRDIEITSVNGKTQKYDLFRSSRFAELDQDPYLRPGDIICINRKTRTASINGAVERPGKYQLLDGENIKQLIEYYGGGLTKIADLSRVELERRTNVEKLTGEKMFISEKEVENDFPLIDEDSVHIPNFQELRPIMFIEGALGQTNETTGEEVMPEGDTKFSVRFNVGERYSSLVRANERLFSKISDLQNAYIIRGQERISLDIEKILYSREAFTDIEVFAGDILQIPFKQFFVSVSGAVATPGRYPYIPDRDWEYYIGLAGGFTEQNSKDAIIIRDMNGKKHSKKDPITPETNIMAKRNSFLYVFGKVAPVVTTVASLTTTIVSICVAATR